VPSTELSAQALDRGLEKSAVEMRRNAGLADFLAISSNNPSAIFCGRIVGINQKPRDGASEIRKA